MATFCYQRHPSESLQDLFYHYPNEKQLCAFRPYLSSLFAWIVFISTCYVLCLKPRIKDSDYRQEPKILKSRLFLLSCTFWKDQRATKKYSYLLAVITWSPLHVFSLHFHPYCAYANVSVSFRTVKMFFHIASICRVSPQCGYACAFSNQLILQRLCHILSICKASHQCDF